MYVILPSSTLTKQQTHTIKKTNKNTQETSKSIHTQNSKEEAQTKGRYKLASHK
jgi:hypothetical protein